MASRVPAVSQALAMLRTLASASGPVPAASLARSLGLPRSTTYHLLAVLADQGFVVHLPEEHCYGLGMAAFELGSAYLRHEPLERLARPLLIRLVERSESAGPLVAHLGVLHGAETLYLLKEQSRAPITLVTDVGVRLPAHLTASGRALLAYLPAAQGRALYPSAAAFVDRTGSGPRSLPELRRALAEDRRRGWAVEDGHVTEGYTSLAAPAFDHAGRPTAAVTVTFRRDSRPPRVWPRQARLVRATAATLTRRLGGQPPPPPPDTNGR